MCVHPGLFRALAQDLLDDTQETANLVPGHDLIVGNTLEQLKTYLERESRIVLA